MANDPGAESAPQNTAPNIAPYAQAGTAERYVRSVLGFPR
jgi:hypothetical protein